MKSDIFWLKVSNKNVWDGLNLCFTNLYFHTCIWTAKGFVTIAKRMDVKKRRLALESVRLFENAELCWIWHEKIAIKLEHRNWKETWYKWQDEFRKKCCMDRKTNSNADYRFLSLFRNGKNILMHIHIAKGDCWKG